MITQIAFNLPSNTYQIGSLVQGKFTLKVGVLQYEDSGKICN